MSNNEIEKENKSKKNKKKLQNDIFFNINVVMY